MGSAIIPEKAKLPTILIQGKEYTMVKDRIMFFNEHYTNGAIITEILNGFEQDRFVINAIVIPDVSVPERKFYGKSQATIGDGYINKTAALENAETSAVGRALAMMGIGVQESIASGDEIVKAQVAGEINRQMAAAKEKKPIFDDPKEGDIAKKAMGVIAAVPNVTTANKLTPQQRVEAIKSELKDGQFVADGQKLLCTLKSALSKNGSKGPFVAVKWNGRYEGAVGANCFHKSLKDALLLGVGKEVWLKLSMNGSYVNIEDVLAVDGVEYSEGHPVDFDEQLKAATHLAIHSDIPF